MKRFSYAFSFILLSVFGVAVVSNAHQRNVRDTKAKVLAAFNWECATTNFPQRQLRGVIRSAMRQVKDEGAWGNGERAVAYDLNGDGVKEYFVLLRTMAIGDNCI